MRLRRAGGWVATEEQSVEMEGTFPLATRAVMHIKVAVQTVPVGATKSNSRSRRDV